MTINPGHARRYRALAALILVPVAPTLLSAWLHPHRPQWVRTDEVSLTEAAAFKDVLWVDARAAAEFSKEHLAGSHNLTPTAWDGQLEAVLAAWSPGMSVVVYCDGMGCRASHEVAKRLTNELGLENVHVLAGGWPALRTWKEGGGK